MKHIVNFSGGLCSFWAAHRVVQKYGMKDTVLLFADVLIEDEDLYAFNRQAEEILGVQITRICVGLTPWQLFRKEGMIANARFPICSVRLKREPLNEWMESHFQMDCRQTDGLRESAAVYLGMDFSEFNRLEDYRAQHPFWMAEAPMCEPELWDKCRMQVEARRIGLKIPRAYELGFPHNNCGMRCVRAGISHFVHLLKVLPEKFLEWEREEEETIAELESRDIAWMSMLKDRRGGTTKTLTLKQLRERVESGEQFPKHDWGGCGCGVQA